MPTYPLTVIGEWYDGTPLNGPQIGWGWLDPDLPLGSPLATLHYGNLKDGGEQGRLTFKAVTAHPGHDEVEADRALPQLRSAESATASQPSLMDISRWGLDFSTLGGLPPAPRTSAGGHRQRAGQAVHGRLSQ